MLNWNYDEPDSLRETRSHSDFTYRDCLMLFGRTVEDGRWGSSADSEEYLALVTYLVMKQE